LAAGPRPPDVIASRNGVAIQPLSIWIAAPLRGSQLSDATGV